MNTFASWAELLTYIASNQPLFYHAPMDYRMTAICVRKVFKNGKIRIVPTWTDGPAFTADSGHLNRFRKGDR